MKRVVIGGTFDNLHRGHIALITKAFSVGDRVLIGLTADELARRLHAHAVEGYARRLDQLKSFLQERGLLERVRIVPIHDPFGPSIHERDLDGIIVSEETFPKAVEINKLRAERALPSLKITRISMVLAEDGKPISSTRMHEREIDRDGRLLKPDRER